MVDRIRLEEREDGAVFAELAVILPFILLLAFGLWSFTILMLHVYFVNDATRSGSRFASHRSNYETSCEALSSEGVRVAEDYFGVVTDQWHLAGLADSWSDPSAEVLERGWDGVSVQIVSVDMGYEQPSEFLNCAFCPGAIFRQFDVRTRYVAELPCA